MTERSVTVAPGIDLAVVEAGMGGRPLLFVHGFGGAKEDFTGWLERCAAEGWHAVACDNRGHGSSSHPPNEDDYSLDLLAADLLSLADALGWSTFTLFGHSMGGMLAQLVALKSPERLDGLILMDTSHVRPDKVEPDAVALGQDIVREGGVALLVEIQRNAGPDPLATAAYQRLIAEDPGYEEFCRNKTLAMSSQCWVAVVDDIITQTDRLGALDAVGVSTLVIVGEQDDGFIRQSRNIADAIPGARLAVIPDAGHSPQFENPEAWWTALSGFLRELEPPKR